MRKSRAITLVEILIVTAIVAVLLAILVFLLPSKEKGLEAHFRAELQQLNTALNMYMWDYDDRYPTRLRAVKAHLPEAPTEPTRLKERLPGCGSGNLYYFYTRSIDILRGEARYTAQYPFDIKVDPVVKAHFFCKKTGAIKEQITFDGDSNPIHRATDEVLVLGVRLDGYAGWFAESAPWENEFRSKAHRRQVANHP